jgi:phage terminase large subunit-like protein
LADVVDLDERRAEPRKRDRRSKALLEHIREGTFRAERHSDLLEREVDGRLEPLVDLKGLRDLQSRYRRAKRPETRKRLTAQFEKAVRERAKASSRPSSSDIERALLQLGPIGSAEQVIAFFPRFFRWDDGSPFALDRSQQEIIREAYRRDHHDRRIYKEIELELGRGGGKTPLATGMGTHALLAAPGRPKVFHASGDKAQAQLGVEYANGWIEESEDLFAWLKPMARTFKRRDGRGSYSIVPASGGLGHGRKPNVGIIDEWWLFERYAQTQTAVALDTALHKLPDAFRFAISTAGYDKETQYGRVHDSGMRLADVRTFHDGFLTIGRDIDIGRLFIRYGVPDGYELDLENDREMLRVLRLANPGSWVDHRELLRSIRRMAAKGELLEALRLYLNIWTRAEKAWLPPGAWRALADETLEIPDGADIFVAVDAAHTIDSTAVSWAWRAPDGRVVVRAKVWSLRPSAPAHVHVRGGSLDNETLVEPFIHGLGGRYRVREVVFDPNFFGTEGRHLAHRFHTAPIFPQSNEMRLCVQEFYKAVVGRRLDDDLEVVGARLAHNGDPILAAHVENIEGQKTVDGYWVIRKLNQSSPIDAGTSTIMAVGRALLPQDEESVYERRDLLVVGPDDEPDDGDDDAPTSQRLSRGELIVLGLLDDDEDDDEDDDY